MHVLYCAVHALRQYQANELLLWERPDVCVLYCFTQIEAIPGSVGSPRCMFLTMCCMHWAIISLTNCYCGTAQMYVLYGALHNLRQSQPDALLLWDRSDACFALCFTRSEAMSGQRIATVGSPRWMFAIVFYTHWSKVRPTDCFCAIAQMRALYYVLHALGQYRNRSPDACFVLLCVSTEAISC